MSNQQPPSFTPNPDRRSLRQRPGSGERGQSVPPASSPAPHSPSSATPRHEAPASLPQTAPVPRREPVTRKAAPSSAASPTFAAPASAPARRSLRAGNSSGEEQRTLPISSHSTSSPRAYPPENHPAARSAQPPAFLPRSGAVRPETYSESRLNPPMGEPPRTRPLPHHPAQTQRASYGTAPSPYPTYGQAGEFGSPPYANASGGLFPQGSLPRPRRKHRIRRFFVTTLILLALLAVWPVYLVMDANNNLGRVDALSSMADTPGTTYLLAGSDSRENGPINDDTEGARADSIMLLHVAENGQTVAISLPRDTWVDIPEYGENKLNASYAFEGPALLVSTVENLTGLKVDHYVEIGMGGVANIVDAVGGVELCLDYDVDDELSELTWTAGCHVVDGRKALAFSRMRYSDPMGDIGRAERQRQVVSQTVKTALTPSTLLWPSSALALERAGAQALTVDSDTSAYEIFQMVRAFRTAAANNMLGTPPIESLGYETHAGSAVLLQDTTAPEFFEKLREGTLTPQDLQQTP